MPSCVALVPEVCAILPETEAIPRDAFGEMRRLRLCCLQSKVRFWGRISVLARTLQAILLGLGRFHGARPSVHECFHVIGRKFCGDRSREFTAHEQSACKRLVAGLACGAVSEEACLGRAGSYVATRRNLTAAMKVRRKDMKRHGKVKSASSTSCAPTALR